MGFFSGFQGLVPHFFWSGMSTLTKADRLRDLVRPAVEACRVSLWGVEFFQQGRRSILRIFIDTEQGVTVDQCAEVSRQVSALLDVEDPIAGEYTLEVSSPGWDRPLFTLEQCALFVGDEISVRLLAPIQGRRRFKGVLTGVADGNLEMNVDGQPVSIAFVQVDKAHRVAD